MFHVYGRDGVMGSLEPNHTEVPKEVGIVFEVTAPTQQLATTIAELSRQPLLHYPIAEWSGSATSVSRLPNTRHGQRGAVFKFNVTPFVEPHALQKMFRPNVVVMC